MDIFYNINNETYKSSIIASWTLSCSPTCTHPQTHHPHNSPANLFPNRDLVRWDQHASPHCFVCIRRWVSTYGCGLVSQRNRLNKHFWCEKQILALKTDALINLWRGLHWWSLASPLAPPLLTSHLRAHSQITTLHSVYGKQNTYVEVRECPWWDWQH
jgi:hypothetical protein